MYLSFVESVQVITQIIMTCTAVVMAFFAYRLIS